MKILFLNFVLFLFTILCKGETLILGSNLNYERSKIHFSNSEYTTSAQPGSSFELGLKHISSKNVLLGFGISKLHFRSLRNFGAIEFSLDYIQINTQCGVHLNKPDLNISLGFYLGLLTRSRVSSPDPILDHYINSGFKKADYGVFLNLQQKVYGWEKLDLGLNGKAAYGLNNIYISDIYPLGGWGNKNQKVRMVSFSLGVFVHYKI